MSQIDNPYVGPRTFTRQESDRFFGREREARDLFSLVVSERLVLFYAQSGAGKSSLLNARLIPQLQEAGFAALPIGRVSGELPASIGEVSNIFTFNLMLNLDQNEDNSQHFAHLPLTDFLARLISADGNHYTYEAEAPRSIPPPESQNGTEAYVAAPHVLIIDQFEEIITTHSTRWPERADFFRQLDQAMTDDPLLWVVLTFREDYLAVLEPYASLLTGKLRARFYMQRMGYEAALAAVKKPAEQAGRAFAPGVAESLVDNLRQLRTQAQSGQPPAPVPAARELDAPSFRLRTREGDFITVSSVPPPAAYTELFSPAQKSPLALGQFVEPVQLQVVCYQLWENLKARPAGEITRQDLQELGNVDTALAEFYEQALAKALAETGEVECDLRDWFEHKLITPAGTRGSVYRGAENSEEISTAAADLLVNQFLLRTESRAGGTWYELVHDRFVEPILQSNQAWRERQPLLQIAQAWAMSGKSEHQLLTREALQDALASNYWRSLGPGVAEYIAASQTAQQAKEAALQAEKETQRQRELEQARALAEAERHRAEAQAKAAGRLRWVIVALALVILSLIGLAGTGMYAFIQRQEVLISHEVITTSLALDGQLYTAVAPDGTTVKLVDTANQELLFSLTGHTAEITKITFSPNTALLATSDRSGTINVWDLRRQGRLVKKLMGHTDTIRYIVFSHDGRLLATGGDDGTTRLWDTSTWEQTFALAGNSGAIISVAFWNDDTYLVTATTTGVYTIWNPWSGEKLVSCRVEQLTPNCQ